jgi:site-specific recombinase XerD
VADLFGIWVTGPLQAHARGFSEQLTELGYTRLSAADQLRLMAHLSRWLASRGLDAGQLTPQRAEQFLRARRRAGHASRLSQRGLTPLLGYLRGQGVTPQPMPAASTPVQQMVGDYRIYLAQERGLAAGTIRRYVRDAGLFLTEYLARDDGDFGALTPGEVTDFVLRECRRRGPGSARNLVASLRSLLRFCYLQGHTARQLAPAVPAAAGWRGGALPRGVEAGQVSRLLRSCDRDTVMGRRDYAILVLLSRLGLRVGEVAALTLDDIDWRHGEIVIRGKGGRRERLPLPADAGQALAGYLSCARPDLASRLLFLRVLAPRDRLSPTGIATVVRAACDRAGLPRAGAHRLRHSAASEMLRAGAGLPEAAQVLRHASLATTAIYAKVDRAALRSLARPWPGSTA